MIGCQPFKCYLTSFAVGKSKECIVFHIITEAGNLFYFVFMRLRGSAYKHILAPDFHAPNPVIVGETRMVKLSDSRFAILYSTTQKGKTSLNYAVYSDTGKKIYSKKYSNMVFDGDSQPILDKGRIIWISSTEKNGKTKTKLYAIPAIF